MGPKVLVGYSVTRMWLDKSNAYCDPDVDETDSSYHNEHERSPADRDRMRSGVMPNMEENFID